MLIERIILARQKLSDIAVLKRSFFSHISLALFTPSASDWLQMRRYRGVVRLIEDKEVCGGSQVDGTSKTSCAMCVCSSAESRVKLAHNRTFSRRSV